MSTAWIRVAYGVVLGLVLLFTVAFGAAMIFPEPKPPENPDITFRQLTSGGDNDSSQNRLTASIDQYYGQAAEYRDEYVEYQRNTFLLVSGLAALLALIGLALPAVVNYLRWGFLLGAALSLAWAGFVALQDVPNPAPAASSVLALLAANEPKQLDFAGRFLRFAISFVSLILLLFIGLWRLTEWPTSTRRTTTTTTTSTTPAAAAAWAPPAAAAATVSPATPAPAAAAEPAGAAPSTTAPSTTAPLATAPAAAAPATVATETTRVVSESPPPSSPEAGQWQRPADAGPTPSPESGA